jgi:hypothetical protein
MMDNLSFTRLMFVAAYLKLIHADAAVISHALDADFDLKNMVDAHNILENARTALAKEFIFMETRARQ